ncbi:hypothetical protein HW555_009866 [Spodoptera exigua]|uniref:Uncharacterized protein n=1 Tax=Spodoptera exigua TaxID=7107 RepID=A0A835GC74_SPOEX|nr:hypothetical protein HW555_009866 [Spodoptera exigua]
MQLDHLNVACKSLSSAGRVCPASRRAASRAHVAVRPRPQLGIVPSFGVHIHTLDHLNVACKPLSSAGRVCPASRRAASRAHVAVRPRLTNVSNDLICFVLVFALLIKVDSMAHLSDGELSLRIRAEANMKCQVKREELVPLRRIKSGSYMKQFVKASIYDKEQFCSHLEASYRIDLDKCLVKR